MAIKRSVRGDGITAHETFSWEREDENDPQIAKIIEGQTFEGMLALIERECFAIMAQAGLPGCYGSWFYNADGEWKTPTGWRDMENGWSMANTHWPLAIAKGYKEDSVVGFAARILQQIVHIKRAWQTDAKKEWAALQSYHLGILRTEMRIKQEHEPKWRTGDKVISAAEKTRKGQQADRVTEVERLLADGLTTKKTAAFAIVAEREGVTAKAIETDYYKAKKKRS